MTGKCSVNLSKKWMHQYAELRFEMRTSLEKLLLAYVEFQDIANNACSVLEWMFFPCVHLKSQTGN